MKAIKGNKVYTVHEGQEKHYQEEGYDIYDDDGNVLAYGRGKMVPYETYAQTARELEELKARLGDEEARSGNKPPDDRAGEVGQAMKETGSQTVKKTGKKAP